MWSAKQQELQWMSSSYYIDVVIITDGKSNGNLDVYEEAKCLHNHSFYNISTFSIGIGNYNTAELNCIEDGDNDNGHIFDFDDFNELEELIQIVIDYLTTPINSTLPPDDPTNYHLCYNLNKPLNWAWPVKVKLKEPAIDLVFCYLLGAIFDMHSLEYYFQYVVKGTDSMYSCNIVVQFC